MAVATIPKIETQPVTDLPTENRIKRSVRIWLVIGVVMVFFQVVIGGVTRLTDSGLSITEWAVIQGTIPPLNAAEWDEAFELYKVAAKKQFETLHADMTMSEFKVIFFWEYFHRLWARMMGFVFIIPFFYFLLQERRAKRQKNADRGRWMPGWLMRRLGVVIALAALAATFGWIMVASGLNEDNRTWVSAYKLVTHLSIATILFGYLFWTWLRTHQPQSFDGHLRGLKRMAWGFTALLLVQIAFGGLMAGMRAGLIHPHFPFFVQGETLLNAINSSTATASDIVNYESSASIKGWVQILHRATAWALMIMGFWYVRKALRARISKRLKVANILLISVLITQFLLGVLTVVNSIGSIPLFYGAAHQAVALLLLITMLYNNYQFRQTANV
ncbi:MAG: COX15/CtaA family protein [Bacteroidota bacterium]